MTFTVAIIGRPNVGKSTLFNRLVGKKLALVHDTPGLTRDWREADAFLMDIKFRAIDTAGLEESFDTTIEGRMRQQTERALARADMALLVVDARSGITPMDRHFADWLRKQNMPTALIVNKCESKAALDGMYEAFELGFGEPMPISAEHGQGMYELYELLRPKVAAAEAAAAALRAEEEEPEENIEVLFQKYHEGDDIGFGDEEISEEDLSNPIKIAIAGRPNVGKSTLLNALVGEERAMTGPEAGITRDAIHVDWEFGGRKLRLVDTAGLRRRARVINHIERMSVDDTMRAIRLAQVVIMVIDGETLFEKQDLTIAGHIIDEGRALIVAINKWDKVKNKEEVLEEVQYQLSSSLAQVRDVPVVTISALKGQRLDKLMEGVLEVYRLWNHRVPTGKLNRWLRMMESQNPAPLVNGRQNRLRYMTQIKARPPTFALWVSRPDEYPDSHKRYLINGLRRDFKMPATPVRFVLRTSRNPYTD
ncbi:MAG TPA: ribosome biogenesis GTPase Der [Alphaproteobacteria bacterium]|jgi:GTP-binding protein|nr:ribosome biogenesis GTPase Der [Alphaproteobacteria bacterium]